MRIARAVAGSRNSCSAVAIRGPAASAYMDEQNVLVGVGELSRQDQRVK